MTNHRLSFGRALPAFLDRAADDSAVSLQAIHYASITGTSGDDALNGTAADDVLQGLGGNDTLDGGAGADKLEGGKGNDTYIVDNAGDQVVESGPGTDSVFASVSYELGKNVENLTLTGTDSIGATGNTAANVITGNSGDNVLDGRGGLDHIDGGDGSDVYLVRNPGEHPAAEFTDSGTTGVDEIRFAYTRAGKLVLFAGDTGIETVVMGTGTGATADSSGTAALSLDATLLGNALTITGNAGANTITGTAFADWIAAGAGNDKITGGAGNDTIIGGTGNDTLIGGTGADLFIFDAKGGTGNVDTLTDFATGADKLELSKAVFTGFAATGAITAAQFYANSTATAAHDADDRIIFNTTTGAIYYDADGTGSTAAVQIAVIGMPHPSVAAGDFVIIN